MAVGAPGTDGGLLTRTTNTKEFADPSGSPVNLGCFSPAGYPPKPSPGATVTLTGRIRVAANGGCTPEDLLGASVEVYTVLRTGDPATDGMPGAALGPALVVSESMPLVSETVDNKCPVDTRYSRVYTFPGVPLDTEILIKTSGDGFAAVYTYNVFPSTGDPRFDAANSTYTEDILLLVHDDFTIWPTAGIGKTIDNGEGMVFGEVHDCGDIRVENATVDVSSNRAGLKYTDDNEDNPLPNTSRVGTGKLSMFLALDMEPGFVRVSAIGLTGSTLSSVGYSDVRVFPDAATHVKLRGLRGFQVP